MMARKMFYEITHGAQLELRYIDDASESTDTAHETLTKDVL